MRYIYILLLPLLFTSCSAQIAGYGMVAVIGLFVLMFILFALMFYLIARRKKQGEKSLVKFNNDVYIALNQLSTPQQKVNMLNNLIERINNDEKYKKDTEWRDKVLLKTYSHLATVYYQMGDEMQTLQASSRIIELDPNDGMAYYNRGSIYSNMGMLDKALADLNRTTELLPDYASAYNNRGLVHEKMEHYDEAINDFNRAIELEDSPIAYYNRGNTYYEQGDYKNALEDYHNALTGVDDINQANLRSEIEASIKITEEKNKETPS
ncbi:tetratricopeptide (TPR) repeat protein [Dysgonomonas hofstadii]|uniref:Tetratricopeptide (TPR) repeat protein n=1 Tax=Dysgonomonas hofstadii TaxID=637886 RepID=A0A840CW91_9BACT|nr:tetratricopeptide repeat protein [Dysgonomonas hofstadii]MBB4036093.1 tetratricopeptide (TPR) repeat protein [Dysgonomonas hofstadii]